MYRYGYFVGGPLHRRRVVIDSSTPVVYAPEPLDIPALFISHTDSPDFSEVKVVEYHRHWITSTSFVLGEIDIWVPVGEPIDFKRVFDEWSGNG